MPRAEDFQTASEIGRQNSPDFDGEIDELVIGSGGRDAAGTLEEGFSTSCRTLEMWEWGDEYLIIDDEHRVEDERNAVHRVAVYDALEGEMLYGFTEIKIDGETQSEFYSSDRDPFGVDRADEFRESYQRLTGRDIEELPSLEDRYPVVSEERQGFE